MVPSLARNTPMGHCRNTAWLGAFLLLGASLFATRQILGLFQNLMYVHSNMADASFPILAYNDIKDFRCPPFRQLCEVSGDCLAVDVADRPRKLLVTAKARVAKLKGLNKTLLRDKHLRIRSIHMFLHGCGFFTFPLIAMNQLWLAHQYGLIGDKKPIVYMPENHHYFSNSTTMNSNCLLDFWETWFEPVHPSTSWHAVKEEDVWEFTQDSIKCAYYDANGIHSYPYYKGDSGTLTWIEKHRQRAHTMMQNYIRIRPEILQQASELFQNLFGNTTTILGIHARGTDKKINGKVDLAEYEAVADCTDKFLNQYGEGKIFLATDNPVYHERMHQNYQGRVVSLPQATQLSWNVLHSNETFKTLKSKKALIDMLLLSHTTSLVKFWSDVSEFAVYVKRSRGVNFQHIFDLQLNVKDEVAEEQSVSSPDQSSSVASVIDIVATNMTRFSDQVLRYNRYLPETLDLGHHELEWQLLAELDQLSSNQTCRHLGQTIWLNPVEWGFGATLHSFVKPVMHSLKHRYCIREPVEFRKFHCRWEDLFLPLAESSVNLTEPLPMLVQRIRKDDSKICAQIFNKKVRYNNLGQPGKFERPAYRKCMEQYSYSKVGDEALPEKYRYMGLFVFVSTILHRLLRPSASMKDRVDREKLAMKWPATPVLGIHYRAGDSCMENENNLGRICDAFDVYMKEANFLRQKYKLTHIYLATDSSDLLQSPLEDTYPGWTFLYVKDLNRGGERNLESMDVLLLTDRIDAFEEATNSLLDILLLSECEAFVGKFSSNMDRAAYSLMYGRTGQYRPYVSLDNAWCFDFGVKSRPSGFNASNPLLYFC